MRFWDSSALVPLLVTEDSSEAMEALFQDEQEGHAHLANACRGRKREPLASRFRWVKAGIS